jgi:hypothetical protein
VRSRRVDGKVKQEFIRYIGKEVNALPARRVNSGDIRVMDVRRSMDVEAVHRIAGKLRIGLLVSPESMVMVYSQLLDRPAINRMEDYLKTTEISLYL